MVGGFKCVKCGYENTKYNYSEKHFECDACGFKRPILSKQQKCFSCDTTYTEYTWFDPSRCRVCHKSFVD